MARPTKFGLDYFPLDVDCDDKIELVEAKYGMVGFAIIVKLWQKIYKNGYYLEWNEEKLLLFKKAVNVDNNLINDIINDSLRWQIFHQDMFNNYKILTSSGIQRRFFNAIGRRTKIDFIENYSLLDLKTVNVDINLINVDINPVNVDIKCIKKRKEKKSKVKNIIADVFDTFWQAYPRKIAKSKALDSWNKIEVDECLLATILTAIENQKKSDQWLKNGGEFIPYPATWLNGKRWEDELAAAAPKENVQPVYEIKQDTNGGIF